MTYTRKKNYKLNAMHKQKQKQTIGVTKLAKLAIINVSHVKNKIGTRTNTYTNTYFIVQCISDDKNELQFKYLNEYLKKINLLPDKAMNHIQQLDLSFIRKLKITPQTYCEKNINLPKLDKTITHKLHPQFMWYHINSSQLNMRLYNTKCNIINIVNNSKLNSVSDKNALYDNMHRYCPEICSKHMANTFKINEFDKYTDLDTISNSTSYYILRPIDSFSGAGILYISSKDELSDAIEYYKKTKNYKGITYGTNVIASKYIINPLLFKGYKFHLRMYYLISYINGEFNSFFYDNYGKILLAGSPYNIEKPFKKEVHDTHVKYSTVNYSFPTDFNTKTITKNAHNASGTSDSDISIEHIVKQMRDIMKGVSTILNLSKGSWLYDNQKNGFHILGIDFMVDTTGRVFLIECNALPGFSYTSKSLSHAFSKSLFKWINDTVLEPWFIGTNPKTHPTYLVI